ncbi:U3 small nucleolar ribonucleoprotein imp3 [Neolecta irregularis DAH-3]|uniref:U3 small nucleolar ribonucleoprotein protein IMP3 n=1 Tax=Neolecta irregularis (strain DAH-3) TaxID=1198029 RepID=A0A1U7LJD3_NEOID|nr:U3 small nucleolar ribonucleoprotein imp3 [Neolecta irregularis DAH-3]|eukprot:OLL22754.1 U3 small nucleolar ribonucleoprotein imp3 [Neolecta irregularis DAH-3]
MGIINGKTKLSDAENKVTVSAFCRRRLPVVMTRMKMCETVSGAVRYIEHGHVRVGPEVISDPAYLVTRNLEDFVTWVDTSKIKRNILKYNDQLDDFDLL